MITVYEAKQLVEERINASDPGWPHKMKMVVTTTVENEFGWIFYWVSSRYLETRSLSDLNAERVIYVLRASGELKEFETAFIQECIDAYEYVLRERFRRHPETDTDL